MRTRDLPVAERCAINIPKEEIISEVLGRNGHILSLVSDQADRIDKVDRFEKAANIWWQLKLRESGIDILYERWKPWLGSPEKSLFGRDHLGKYDMFAGLSKDKKTVRVGTTKEIKEIVDLADKEWESLGCPLTNNCYRVKSLVKEFVDPEFGEVEVGVEIRRVTDWLEREGRPKIKIDKILIFIPVQFFENMKFYSTEGVI